MYRQFLQEGIQEKVSHNTVVLIVLIKEKPVIHLTTAMNSQWE